MYHEAAGQQHYLHSLHSLSLCSNVAAAVQSPSACGAVKAGVGIHSQGEPRELQWSTMAAYLSFQSKLYLAILSVI